MQETGNEQGQRHPLLIDQKALKQRWLAAGISQGNHFGAVDVGLGEADPEAAAPWKLTNHHWTFTTYNGTLPIHALEPISGDVMFGQLFGDGWQKQCVDEFREGLSSGLGGFAFGAALAGAS